MTRGKEIVKSSLSLLEVDPRFIKGIESYSKIDKDEFKKYLSTRKEGYMYSIRRARVLNDVLDMLDPSMLIMHVNRFPTDHPLIGKDPLDGTTFDKMKKAFAGMNRDEAQTYALEIIADTIKKYPDEFLLYLVYFRGYMMRYDRAAYRPFTIDELRPVIDYVISGLSMERMFDMFAMNEVSDKQEFITVPKNIQVHPVQQLFCRFTTYTNILSAEERSVPELFDVIKKCASKGILNFMHGITHYLYKEGVVEHGIKLYQSIIPVYEASGLSTDTLKEDLKNLIQMQSYRKPKRRGIIKSTQEKRQSLKRSEMVSIKSVFRKRVPRKRLK